MIDPPESPVDIKEWVLATLEKWGEVLETRMNKQDERIDGLEQQLAILTSAYAELAVLVQTLVYTKLTLDDQPDFDENLAKGKQEMLRTFQDALRQNQTESERFYPSANTTQPDT